MDSKQNTETLEGYDAIERAERDDAVTIAKRSDPTEGHRSGLSVDEAREVAFYDPGLIFAVYKGSGEAVKP